MTTAQVPTIALGSAFARDLPEMSVAWTAAQAPAPSLLVLNDSLACDLGLDPESLRSPDGARFLVGNLVPDGATPVAQAYAGHQFGGFVPRLGDGRALLLGELTDNAGRTRDLHLKGSGRTPFARGGDGLAAVGPMLREYVVSEAMHALGIPTTRSLAVVATGQDVQRESVLPGAVLARVAGSHLRVGSFQYASATGDIDLLRRLVDVAVTRHYPQAGETQRPALALFEAVVAAQASLVAQWMLVGFVHGVLNTDNVTISGETIDYGPCAFMDAFDTGTVFSSIDTQGRYAFSSQPPVMEWNLARLAEALIPVVDPDEKQAIDLLTAALGTFRDHNVRAWRDGLHAKVGLDPTPGADALVEDLLALLQANHPDLTMFFRALARAARGDVDPVRGLVLDLVGLDAWLERWRALDPDADAMDTVNPVYVPRNHLVEEALDAGTAGDLAPFHALVDAVGEPFTERPGLERYAEPGPGTTYTTYCGT